MLLTLLTFGGSSNSIVKHLSRDTVVAPTKGDGGSRATPLSRLSEKLLLFSLAVFITSSEAWGIGFVGVQLISECPDHEDAVCAPSVLWGLSLKPELPLALNFSVFTGLFNSRVPSFSLSAGDPRSASLPLRSLSR